MGEEAFTGKDRSWDPPNMIKSENVEPFDAVWSYMTAKYGEIKNLFFTYDRGIEGQNTGYSLGLDTSLSPGLGDFDKISDAL